MQAIHPHVNIVIYKNQWGKEKSSFTTLSIWNNIPDTTPCDSQRKRILPQFVPGMGNVMAKRTRTLWLGPIPLNLKSVFISKHFRHPNSLTAPLQNWYSSTTAFRRSISRCQVRCCHPTKQHLLCKTAVLDLFPGFLP